MKNLFVFIVCNLIFFSLKLNAQEKIAIIDLSKNYESGLSENNYYQLFKLPLNLNQKQIEEFKANSLKHEHVKNINVLKTSDNYDVSLLLDKETENISGFFLDYLLSVSINKLIIDGKTINTIDYYTYLSHKYSKPETSK